MGISETADADPLGEDFSCWPFFAAGVPTGKICKGFRWQNGQMTALPPFPGGYSSYATGINNQGQVVGWAENGIHDPTCDPSFQILQFRAAMWEPNGTMHELPPLPGDSTSAATAINDLGQVVGISGDCGIAVGSVSAKHAVLWQNGVPIDLGNIGGDAWNTPTAINNQGTIIGFQWRSSECCSRSVREQALTAPTLSETACLQQQSSRVSKKPFTQSSGQVLQLSSGPIVSLDKKPLHRFGSTAEN